MSNAENAFIEVADKLIGLYREVERNTLDLPPVSAIPALIWFWAVLKFYFFLIIGSILIIPTNLVIFVRNLFPGRHWKYRAFFLRHLHYVWLWVWRGEAPTAPFIFVRPLLNIFMKGHFERRLRRLRLEILLSDGLSDSTRTTLLARLDAAIERWKTPRLATFFTVLLPAILSFISGYKELIEFLGFEVPTPASLVSNLVSERMSPFARNLAFSSVGYLLAVPITSFLAKRGLFLGADANRVCFPGEIEGCGVYAKEKEILDSVGLYRRETPLDIWLLAVSFVIGYFMLFLTWNNIKTMSQYQSEGFLVAFVVLQGVVFVGLFLVAAVRRRRTGRA